jgi:hypothetical protein
MKLLNKENNSIIETNDEARIEKLLGYPDKFEKIEEKEIVKDEIKKPKKNK